MSKISIAMATYNGGRYLQQQLDSFLAQTRQPDELIVCDDQSTDATREILDQFRHRAGFPVQVIRNEKQLGVVKNFEKAVRHCTGDLIFFSDQDDFWAKEKLQRHEAAYNADEAVGMVFSDAQFVDDTLKPTGETMFHKYKLGAWEQAELETDRAFRVLHQNTRVSGCTASFRAKYREVLLPFDECTMHDDWCMLILALVTRIRCLPEPLISYRLHDAQVIGSLDRVKTPGGWTPNRQFLLQDRARILTHVFFHKERLHRQGIELGPPELTEYLARAIASLWRRSLFSNRLWKRLPGVALECLSGNYARYNRLKNALSYDLRPKYYFP